MSQTSPTLIHMDVFLVVPMFGDFKGTPKKQQLFLTPKKQKRKRGANSGEVFFFLLLGGGLGLGDMRTGSFFEEQLCSGRRPFWGGVKERPSQKKKKHAPLEVRSIDGAVKTDKFHAANSNAQWP